MSYCYQKDGVIHKFEYHADYLRFKRGFDHFESMEAMVEYLEKNGAFQSAGWRQSFLGFYISDYCLDRLYDFITADEAKELREYQALKRAEAKAADEAREWKLVDRIYWADNSEEEIYEDKDGNRKTVMVVGPHGDAC